MSDSLALRRRAKERFGEKLITDTQEAAVHVDCYTGCKGNATRGERAMQVHATQQLAACSDCQQLHAYSDIMIESCMLSWPYADCLGFLGLQTAIGEILTLAMTDVQVIADVGGCCGVGCNCFTDHPATMG